MGVKERGVMEPEPKSAEEADEGDEAAAPSNESLRYVAANNNHNYMVGKRLRGSQGITWGVFKEGGAAEAAGDEGDGGDEGDEGDKKEEAAAAADEGPQTVEI